MLLSFLIYTHMLIWWHAIKDLVFFFFLRRIKDLVWMAIEQAFTNAFVIWVLSNFQSFLYLWLERVNLGDEKYLDSIKLHIQFC